MWNISTLSSNIYIRFSQTFTWIHTHSHTLWYLHSLAMRIRTQVHKTGSIAFLSCQSHSHTTTKHRMRLSQSAHGDLFVSFLLRLCDAMIWFRLISHHRTRVRGLPKNKNTFVASHLWHFVWTARSIVLVRTFDARVSYSKNWTLLAVVNKSRPGCSQTL